MMRAIPALPVKEIDAATAHYRDKFGFNVAHKDEGFAILKRDGIEIHLWAASDTSWRDRPGLAANVVSSGAEDFIAGTASCRVEVEGIDALFAEYRASGVLYNQVLGRGDRTDEVTAEPWGVRDFHTLDLEHNLLTFYEAVR